METSNQPMKGRKERILAVFLVWVIDVELWEQVWPEKLDFPPPGPSCPEFE